MKNMIPFLTMLALVGAVASVQAISINNQYQLYPNVRKVNPALQQNMQKNIKANPNLPPRSVLNQNIAPSTIQAPRSLNTPRSTTGH